ncbi:MAG: nicotinamide-nucleotide amidohydrolase family protein [Williamsia sp.]|nr:nicotinamide-nucleotide amidohydrolase family protein [Williamsia sp.]
MAYDLNLIDSIKDILIEKGKTLSLAESVTGGHLQALFSAATDASKFFQGGITVYNIGQKCRHLNVEPVHAQNNNCVTQKVASQMATEVNKLFLSDYGIAITGYASTIPDQGVNDLFAFVAIAEGDKVIIAEKLISDKEEGVEAQQDYCLQIASTFKDLLEEKHP